MKTNTSFILVVAFALSNLLGTVFPSNYGRIELPEGTIGPESIAFDNHGRGPYTGVSDGRVIRWDAKTQVWADFSVPSENRPPDCNGSQDPNRELICGRPLGLQFKKATGELYIADSSYGLLRVGSAGGTATQVATEAGGVPLTFTNGLDINQDSGMVYFVDSSTRFRRRDHDAVVSSNDNTGRLLRYNPDKDVVTVLMSNIVYPNGLALSKDCTFLLMSETTTGKIIRFWLQGPKEGQQEDFATVPGYPDNIKRNSRGEFWIAIAGSWARVGEVLAPTTRFQTGSPTDIVAGMLFDENGNILEVLGDDGGALGPISEVNENGESLWFGSVEDPYVSTYHA